MEEASTKIFLGLFTFGNLRVYLLTCFGIYSYLICQKLKGVSFSQAGSILLTIIELVGYAWCILVACFKNGRNYQFCVILTLVFTFAISFSGKSYASKLFPGNHLTNFCAKFSLAIYLTHNSVLRLFKYRYPEISIRDSKVLYFVVIAGLTGLGYMVIIWLLWKAIPVVKRKGKEFLLQEE